MKKLFFIICALALLSISSYVIADHFWNGDLMPIDEVKQRWGEAPFDEAKFKSGGYGTRASMGYALIKSKKYIGRSPQSIEASLGRHDGYYFTDFFPAYLIELGNKKGDDVWQIVFLLNLQKKIDDVVVHKNCCDHEQKP